MPLQLGWTAREQDEYLALLFSHHQIDIEIQILKKDHTYVNTFSNLFVDGQVDYDEEGDDNESSCNLTFFDPTNRMELAGDSPDEGALFLDRMVKITYCVGRPDGSKWYKVPIFCGPIKKADRDENYFIVEAAGKESLLQDVWNSENYKEDRYIENVMLDILNQYGEDRKHIHIQNTKRRLSRKLVVGYEQVPWQVLKFLGSQAKRAVYYDGRGVFQAVAKNSSSTITINEKRLMSKPQVGYNTDNLVNAVRVIGAKPKGKGKKRVSARAVARKDHPLSPASLGRNGKPHYYPLIIQDDKCKTKKQCLARAKKELQRGLDEAVEVAFTSVVIPHLQTVDWGTLAYGNATTKFRFRKFSFSLNASCEASYGFNKELSPDKKKIRRLKK